MRRLAILIKYLFWLALVAGVALVGYALISDLPAPVVEREVPIPMPAEGG
ncbi:MAG: hypothetical protein ACFBSD_07820 [Paracoccaceae bacterium]